MDRFLFVNGIFGLLRRAALMHPQVPRALARLARLARRDSTFGGSRTMEERSRQGRR